MKKASGKGSVQQREQPGLCCSCKPLDLVAADKNKGEPAAENRNDIKQENITALYRTRLQPWPRLLRWGKAPIAQYSINHQNLNPNIMTPKKINLLFSVLLSGSTALNAQNGNVGIGTMTPAEKLDVNGNIQLNSSSSVHGSYLQALNPEGVTMTLQATRAASAFGAGGIIGTNSAHPLQLIYNASPVIFMNNGTFAPNGSNLTALGTDANRWNTIYTGGGGVNAKNASGQYVGFSAECQGGIAATFTATSTSSAFGGRVIMGSATNNQVAFVVNSQPVFYMDGGSLLPNGNNNKQLGYSYLAFSAVHAYSFNNPSDIRFKKNIENLKYGINEIMKMRAVSYDLKDNKNEKKMIGFIAQEVEKVIPEIVSTSHDSLGYKSVDYVKLVPVLVKSIQDQQQVIEKQLKELKTLKATADVQRLQIAALEAKAADQKTMNELIARVAALQEILGLKVTAAAKESSSAY